MDTAVQKVLLNAVVCLYAVLGFSLSVLTSFLGLLGTRQPPKPVRVPQLQPSRPRSRPIPRTLRSCSDKPPTVVKPTVHDTQRRRKMLATHRRSRSIPLITLDYFGSTEDLPQDVERRSHLGSLPVRKPLTFALPPPPGRAQVGPPWSADYDTEKSGFKLANLFSKDKKRDKEVIRKVSERNTPSPPPASPQLDGSSVHQAQIPGKGQGAKRPLLSKEGQENVVRAPMRRVSSAPAEERLTMKFDLTFSRTVEKKKSSTLRTQPYEAPFFCPPPIQPTRFKSRSTLDLTSKSQLKNSPRSSTMLT